MSKKKKEKNNASSSAKTNKSSLARKTPKVSIYSSEGFWLKNKWVIAVFTVLGIGLYFQSIPYGYILDDQIVISDNEYTQEGLNGIWKILTTESFQGYFGKQRDLVQGGRYRPLSIVTFAIEQSISKNNPALQHIINILLYILCGLLLFRIFSFLIPEDKSFWFMSIPFAAATLYMVHPVHVEAIANIKGRDEIMAFIFSLATMYYSFKYILQKKNSALILMAFVYYLGILSKENTLTFLGVVPMTLFLFTRMRNKDILKVLGVLLTVTVLYLIQRYAIIGYLINTNLPKDVMNNPFAEMNGSQKNATVTFTLLKYLGLGFFPHPLTHDYYPYHIPKMEWSNIWVLSSLLIHIGLTTMSLLWIRKKPLIAWCILFYIMTISIVSNAIFNVGTFMNERFIFISSAAFCVFLAHLFLNIIPSKGWFSKKIGMGIIGLIVLLFAIKTITRVPAWENAMTLNRSAVKVSKNSARANSFMATALYKEALNISDNTARKSNLLEAQQYSDKALTILPNYGNANLMAAGIAAEIFKIDKDIDKLIATFITVGTNRPQLEFLKEFSTYLNDVNPAKMTDFYYELGHNVLFQQKKNYKWAQHILLLGNTHDPSNVKIKQSISKIYRMMGDENAARKYE